MTNVLFGGKTLPPWTRVDDETMVMIGCITLSSLTAPARVCPLFLYFFLGFGFVETLFGQERLLFAIILLRGTEKYAQVQPLTQHQKHRCDVCTG